MALKLEIAASLGGDALRGLSEMERKLQDISRVTQAGGMSSGFGKISADLKNIGEAAKSLTGAQSPFQSFINMFSEAGRRQNDLFGEAGVRNIKRYAESIDDLGRRKDTLIRRQEQLSRMMNDPGYAGNKDRLAGALDQATLEYSQANQAQMGARMDKFMNARVGAGFMGGASLSGIGAAIPAGLAIGAGLGSMADVISGFDSRSNAALSGYYGNLGREAASGKISRMATINAESGMTGKLLRGELLAKFGMGFKMVGSGIGRVLQGDFGGIGDIFNENARARFGAEQAGAMDTAEIGEWLDTGGAFFKQRGRALSRYQKSFGARSSDADLRNLQGATGLTMDQLAPVMDEMGMYNVRGGQAGTADLAKSERDRGFTQRSRSNILRMGATMGLTASMATNLGLQSLGLYGTGGYQGGPQANYGMMQSTSEYLAGQQEGYSGSMMGLAASQQARLAGSGMFAAGGVNPESLRVGANVAGMDIGASAGSMKETMQMAALSKLGITGVAAMSLINMGLETDSAKELLIQRLIAQGLDRPTAISKIEKVLGGATKGYDTWRGKIVGGGQMLGMAKDLLKAQGDKGQAILAMGDEAIMAGIGATGGDLKDVNTLMKSIETRGKGGYFSADQMPSGMGALQQIPTGPTAALGDTDVINKEQAKMESGIQDSIAQIPDTILKSIADGFQSIVSSINVARFTTTGQAIEKKAMDDKAKTVNPTGKRGP